MTHPSTRRNPQIHLSILDTAIDQVTSARILLNSIVDAEGEGRIAQQARELAGAEEQLRDIARRARLFG